MPGKKHALHSREKKERKYARTIEKKKQNKEKQKEEDTQDVEENRRGSKEENKKAEQNTTKPDQTFTKTSHEPALRRSSSPPTFEPEAVRQRTHSRIKTNRTTKAAFSFARNLFLFSFLPLGSFRGHSFSFLFSQEPVLMLYQAARMSRKKRA